MGVWDHMPVMNLINLQRLAALKEIDAQIQQDWRGGYGSDVDALLERRQRIVEQMRRGLSA